MALREIELAYIAGLFDGEGSIGSSPSRKAPMNYRVYISIGMCDRAPIDFAASVLGGKVVQCKRMTLSGKPVYTWKLWCQKAADVLEQLMPYLLIKRERAEKAIQLARMMNRGNATLVRDGGEIDLIAERHEIAELIRNENFKTNARIIHFAQKENLECPSEKAVVRK